MILVTGGTGLVGNRVVQLLISNQQSVRVMARGLADWKESFLPQFRRIGVDVVTGDIRDPDRVAAAVAGCQAIVNCAGVMRSTPDYPCDEINIQGTANLAAAAESQGIQRFIQISCLSVTQHSECQQLSSKWQAEQIIKSSKFHWTIMRPSFVFGDHCHLMELLNFWTAHGPIIPVVGSGLNEIRPISADDVAACIVQSIYNRKTASQTYELVGPQSYTLTQLLEMSVNNQGKSKPLFKLPTKLGLRLAGLIARFIPKGPVDEDVIKFITTDSTGDPAIMQSTFQVKGLPFESSLKQLSIKG